MNLSKLRSKHSCLNLLIATCSLLAMEQAIAFKIDTSPEWSVNWENSVLYNLGIRAQKLDSDYGNNPALSESEYKFAKRGDVITNRIQNLSEIDIVYMDQYGARLSGSIWKDFAYSDDKVENHPGLTNALWGSRTDGHYADYTKRYYQQGGEFLDAFVFANFQLVEGLPASVRIGRLTQFWGNAQFYGNLGINYAQNPSDGLKGLQAPGSTAKELALPRLQILLQTGLTDTVSVSAQMFGEFRPNRLPEGGTFFGPFGFGIVGPDRAALAAGFFVPRGTDIEPSPSDDWGVKLDWTPNMLAGGKLGFYYRELSETQPWLLFTPTLSNYHLSYAKDVTLYGVSLDTSVGDDSLGLEVSYRKNTALGGVSRALASDPLGTEGARGNTLQILLNNQGSLTPRFAHLGLWDTGAYLFEFAYQRKLATTKNGAMYSGENTIACPAGWKEGCLTEHSLGVAGLFRPQWVAVIPGLNLSLPIFLQYQLSGNAVTRAGGSKRGNTVYSVGLAAQWLAKYDATLTYSGIHGRTNGRKVAGPVGTYNASDRGGFGVDFWNDRARLNLTLGTTF